MDRTEEILEINLKALEKNQPSLYKKVMDYVEEKYESKYPLSCDVAVGIDDNGTPLNILINNMLLDYQNPSIESFDWISKSITKKENVEFVFGMGLGYNIENIMKMYPYKKIFIIEPNVELFYNILQTRDITFIIEKAIIFLEENSDVFYYNFIQYFVNDATSDGVKFHSLSIYTDLFPDLWKEFSDRFLSVINSLMSNIVTRKNLSHLWIKNHIKNLPKINNAANTQGLIGSFKDVPAILVSAGPSLEKNVELLKTLKNKCLIVSAATATTCLKQFGIVPDLFATVDASQGEDNIVKSIDSKDNTYMLYSNQLYPECLNIYKGKRFLMNYLSDFYTTLFFQINNIKSEPIMSAPSVSNTIFDLLYKMGCNPIIFVGQDLCLTAHKMYAGNIENFTDTMDYAKEGFILKKNIYNEDVYTSPGYLTIKDCFEEQVKMTENLSVYNCTEGGLEIKGIVNKNLQEVIDEYDFKDRDIPIKLIDIYNNSKFGNLDDKIKTFKDLLLKELDALNKIILKQIRYVKNVMKSNLYRSKKSFLTFRETVDNPIKDIENTMIYKAFIEPLIYVEFRGINSVFHKECDIIENKDITDAIKFKEKRIVYLETFIRQCTLIKKEIKFVKTLLEEEP